MQRSANKSRLHRVEHGMMRPLALLALYLLSTALMAQRLLAGGLSEFKVELTPELRQLAGRGTLSPVTHALVTIAVPANFDMAGSWPVMVISATSDPKYNSSRQLLGVYADTALADGWILVAADPEEDISVEQDDVTLRYVLNTAALAVLELQWPGAGRAPLAFGGFSGGSKYSGWLAAAFASQNRAIMGVYLAGINQNTLVSGAHQFKVLSEAFRGIPVFLQSGEKDEVSTPSDHRGVRDELRRAGFRNIRIEYFRGGHVVDAQLLGTALEWFREIAAQPAEAK